MIVILCGPDDYRREAKRKYFVAEFEKKYSSRGVETFDLGEEDAFLKLQSFLHNQSIFAPVKLAVLTRAFEVQPELLAPELQRLATDRRLHALLSSSTAPPKALQFLTKLPSEVHTFEFLRGAAWQRFVAEEARTRSVKLTTDALRFLALVYADDPWRLVTDLEKIRFWKTTIDVGDLEAVDVEIPPDFFALLSRLKGQEVGDRLRALEQMFSQNEPAAKIFNILASQWQDKRGVMADYDFLVKSGKLDYEEALVDLLVR